MLTIVLVIMIAVFLWWRFQGGNRASLRFEEGKLATEKGKLADNERRALIEVAELWKVSGRVTIRHGRGLAFSRSVKGADRQRFRNAFFTTQMQ
jgi:hypothetical protein